MTAITAWPGQAQDWLDARGKAAWIAAMVLGFIFFWPVGLALLFYMIWSKRMFTGSCRHARHHHRHGRHGWGREWGPYGMPSSGNTAFDAYKADTLRRLEEEQEAFNAFLQRLRDAKDKQEFDAFMDDRARAAREGTPDTDPKAD
ncbi:DUF2852 domain-containing protein [Acidimangrovimonas sediminis]|uniref:DUF2852 domain-containing protein n=1 Tax=Acidimangrovimonas sediminis TaxID=2056283 RepID=UPI000C7FDB63|nr:DUF2852 domain-containing protein [Acidimangrovimonas sediminis]